jgi:DNA-binding NarL/FixJ family response regulator
MIRVLLVDDHPIVLSGLSALVQSDDGLALIATAGTVDQAMAVTAQPDVAVVDLELPDGDGIHLGAALKERWPGLRVVVLTMHADDQAVMRSLGSGLDGYLLKDSDPDDVLRAIHAAAHGTLVLGKGTAGAVVAAAATAPRTDALGTLDARELEILELLAQGMSTGQIAARLYLAPKTIRNRVSEIVGKLGTANPDQAIALGRAAGLGRGAKPGTTPSPRQDG